MRVLIVEDDFTSRLMIQKILQPYGEVHIAVDGDEALEAFQLAWQEQAPYELICLDIMLPKMDGQEVLKQIRNLESQRGIGGRDSVKIIMISALSDKKYPGSLQGPLRSIPDQTSGKIETVGPGSEFRVDGVSSIQHLKTGDRYGSTCGPGNAGSSHGLRERPDLPNLPRMLFKPKV